MMGQKAAVDRDFPWRRLSLLAGLAFLWPALVNGMPFLFYDTPGYLGGANALAHGLFGAKLDWTAAPVMLGRSIYYGSFLYLSLALAGFWPAAILQAALTGVCVVTFLRYFVPLRVGGLVLGVVIAGLMLLACTTLPFFATFMMPDLFSGLALLSATALLLFWKRDGWRRRAFWIGVTAAAALFHPTNVPILLSVVAVCILLHYILEVPRPWLSAAIVLAAASSGIAGEAIFSAGVDHAMGQPPIRPPFVTARLTADGPGTRYLRDTCPKNGFLLCRYISRLPLPSDYFLWSRSSADGVFRAIPPAQRRQLAAEETRFVIATVLHLPLETISKFFEGAYKQMNRTGLNEFNYGWIERGFFKNNLPPHIYDQTAQTRAFELKVPAYQFARFTRTIAIVSLFICLWAMFDRNIPKPLRMAVAMILCGIIVNAFICGGLSGAHDRYQARVIWLAPWIAYLALLARIFGPKAVREAAPAPAQAQG
ncbi:hypothetical protein [Sphingobium phenoxybenzoativorans]|uniref:hypothetical protein n=1 Tax=Sphingobium phenoxybenzoativorans TaxID=1592790 RepID=UPI001112D807|nr:hypothetical protein [Sphingobium phenoxybenzoativorans]